MTDRTDFDINGEFDGQYTPLLEGENDYGSNNFDDLIDKNKQRNSNSSGRKAKRGRPVVKTDARFKVSVPTKISPATDAKLSNLKSYMSEFREITGRITFDTLIDTLAENYIKTQLPSTKEKILREQIQEDFDSLKK